MNWSKRILLVLSVAFFAGCARVHTERRATQYVPFTGLESADAALIRKHCPFGKPKADPFWIHGPTVEITRPGYALLHSSKDKIPLWVCEYVTKSQLEGPLNRPDPDDHLFRPDPNLTTGIRSERADYRGSGYDRGHQAPAGNQTADQGQIEDTFYLSNMAPQVGVGFNRSVWANLESRARDWIEARNEGYIITGPIFYDPNEETGNATGWTTYKTIGKRKVAVPTHFFKIVVAKSPATQEWEAIGFVFQNRKYPKGHKLSSNEVKAIDWIEKRAGFDFMPDLSVEDQRRIERSPSELWN